MNKSVLAKIFAILIFLGCIALWIFYPRHLPPPDEANRIMHPDGYSFIRPAGWKSDFMTAEATLNSVNRGWLRADPPNKGEDHDRSAMVVTVLSQAPDPKHPGFNPGTFQGHPALIYSDKFKDAWAYRIEFQDHGQSFEINLSTPYQITGPDSDWWPYINSFRFEPEKAKKKAATQTTMPVFVFPTNTFGTTQPTSN